MMGGVKSGKAEIHTNSFDLLYALGVNRVFASLTEWTLFPMVLGKILGCVHAHKMRYMFAWVIIFIKESSLSRT